MIGKRRDIDEGELHNPGEYGKFKNMWLCCTPNGHAGNLSSHNVIENDDGTITVSPSILVGGKFGMPQLLHGYLKNGIWKQC